MMIVYRLFGGYLFILTMNNIVCCMIHMLRRRGDKKPFSKLILTDVIRGKLTAA